MIRMFIKIKYAISEVNGYFPKIKQNGRIKAH